MQSSAIHPGEHLAEELKELKISAAELGRRLKVFEKSDYGNIECSTCYYR